MRRFLALSLVVLATSMTLGCDQKAKTSTTEKVTGPGGTTTTTDTHEVQSSGKNPPANSQGEAVK